VSVLAVIPARLGATRLPRKPLRLLAGLPLVVRVWQRVVELDVADTVVVATDSDEVARVAIEHGIAVAMTSPEHSSGTERIAELVQQPSYRDFQAIINVQGDEPELDPSDLARVVDAFADRIEFASTGHVDSKTELQEALARTGRVVQYDVLAVEGPPHERRFVCAALIDGERLGVGRGSTKKAAEQEAAAQALATLQVPQAEA